MKLHCLLVIPTAAFGSILPPPPPCPGCPSVRQNPAAACDSAPGARGHAGSLASGPCRVCWKQGCARSVRAGEVSHSPVVASVVLRLHICILVRAQYGLARLVSAPLPACLHACAEARDRLRLLQRWRCKMPVPQSARAYCCSVRIVPSDARASRTHPTRC